MNKQFTIKTHCVFCGSESFDTETKTETTISCAKCGKQNLLTALREQATNKATQNIRKDLESEIQKIFKNKTIKLKF